MKKNESLTPASQIPSDIANLCQEIERWRQIRRHRERMPEQLWMTAAVLARQHSVARIARLARLDYYALRERLETLGGQSESQREKRPTFVELPLALSTPTAECVVELEHPRRGRMRIHVKGAPGPDFAELSRSFWSFES